MKTLFKLTISGVFIYLVLRHVQFGDVLRTIVSYPPQVLAEVFALQFFALAIAAVKWRSFLPEALFGRLFRFTLIGQFYSLVLPGQLLGEVAKAYSFARG